MRRSTPIPGLLAAASLCVAAAACGDGGGGPSDGRGGGAVDEARGDAAGEAGGSVADEVPGGVADEAGENTAREARDASRGEAADRQEIRFVAREGVLYRRSGDGERPILALDSATAPAGVPAVPERWSPAPDVRFGVDATSFRHLVPSPDSRRVAWEAGSTHDLLGVVAADGSRMTVLDFYFDSSARELAWSPSGRYLAVLHLPPSGLEEVRVYDAEAGTRLRAPWEESCRPRDGCRVTRPEWTGATTLAATAGDGTGRHHEIDVSGLPTASSGRR